MKAVLVILILLMIAKDAAHIGYPFVMRGFAQGLCLLVGAGWMMVNFKGTIFKKYWPIFGYLGVSLVSGILSPRMEYALIQTASLAAVLLFAIAYFESQDRRPGDSSELLLRASIFPYAVICLISILLVKLSPSLAYGAMKGWTTNPEDANRFRGLFSTSGMMGAASGLLIGFVLFREGKWWWRMPVLALGLACLALTQSRTFWVAAFVAAILVWWVYKPEARKVLIAVTLGVVMMVGTILMLGINVDTGGIEKAARTGSISTLTGRIPLWEKALDSFVKSPFLGYGSTMGAYALMPDESNTLFNEEGPTGRALGYTTMHNGYIQTLLDVGLFGLFFYVMIFVVSLRRIYFDDRLRKYGAVAYGIIFMGIANLGESIVYSAATSHSVVFLCLVACALHRISPEAAETPQYERPAATKRSGYPGSRGLLNSKKRMLK